MMARKQAGRMCLDSGVSMPGLNRIPVCLLLDQLLASPAITLPVSQNHSPLPVKFQWWPILTEWPPKDPYRWYSHLCVDAAYREWSRAVLATGYCVWLTRQGHKRLHGFSFASSWSQALGEVSCHVGRILKKPSGESDAVENWPRASNCLSRCDGPPRSGPSSYGKLPDVCSMTSLETPSHNNSYTAPELLSIESMTDKCCFKLELGLSAMQQQITNTVCAKPGNRWQKTEKEWVTVRMLEFHILELCLDCLQRGSKLGLTVCKLRTSILTRWI